MQLQVVVDSFSVLTVDLTMIDKAIVFKQEKKSPMKEMHMLHEINTLAPDINQDSRGLLTWTIFFFEF